MSYAVAIDPATCTGLALVSYQDSGPPGAVSWGTVSVKDEPRQGWLHHLERAVLALCLPHEVDPAQVIWLIEDWPRHQSHQAAVTLARVQQTWLDLAAQYGARAVLVQVMAWQVPTGVNQAALAAVKGLPKGHHRQETGHRARKAAAARWAKATYRLRADLDLPEDVTDALAMAGWWVTAQRQRAARLPF